MFFHVPDHLGNFVLLFRNRISGGGFPDEQPVAQPAQEFIQVIDGLAGGQRKDIVDFLNGAFPGQCFRMGVHQGTDDLSVDHPEGKGGHICVFQEMQQITDSDIQDFPAAQRQCLADGIGDFPCLRENFLQIRGNIPIEEHLLTAHDKPVFIGGGGFQIGGGSLGKIRMRSGNGGDAAFPAGAALPADYFRHSRQDLRLIGKDQIQVGFQRYQFHTGAGITGKTVKGRSVQIKGMIVPVSAVA